MLTQYRLTMRVEGESQVRQEWGYYLYAALLESAPHEFGELLHGDSVTPVSQFVQTGPDADRGGTVRWTVNLLGSRIEQVLVPVLMEKNSFMLKSSASRLTVVRRESESIPEPDDLLRMAEGASGMHRLRFITSTAFKSQGKYLSLPTCRLIVRNLVKKWNGCFDECTIEDDDGCGLDALAAGLNITGLKLSDKSYNFKGREIPGFVGELTLENNLGGFRRQLLNALLIFSGYAGVGIKTALGMGGVEHIGL
jgi:CRISPR-associated endoribonuclease Cas6